MPEEIVMAFSDLVRLQTGKSVSYILDDGRRVRLIPPIRPPDDSELTKARHTKQAKEFSDRVASEIMQEWGYLK